jgi:hypothetical protein
MRLTESDGSYNEAAARSRRPCQRYSIFSIMDRGK